MANQGYASVLASRNEIADWTRLRSGSQEQRKAFEVLERSAIMRELHQFSPTLIGTFPLDIQIEGSDLDIACCFPRIDLFRKELAVHLGGMPKYELKSMFVRGMETVIARFIFEGYPFEIFGQEKSVEEQYGFRHLIVESILLGLGGDTAKSEIRKLKQSGLKTEPAFAKYFRMEGDPYEKLYELSFLDESEIQKETSGFKSG